MSAKKSLGQHFLTSKAVVRDIVEAADLSSNISVLEIGPGKGVLTRALLDTGARVVAVELDHELVEHLQSVFQHEISSDQLQIVEEDILSFNPERYFDANYRIIANIPYYITGKILRQFLGGTHQPEKLVLLMQKEVARRIVARDGKESLLSLAVKVYGEPRIVRTVPRRFFDPKPNVDSAVLSIEDVSRDFFADLDEKLFFSVIRAGFGHKRKKLSNNLEPLYTKEAVEEMLEKIGKDKNTRAEDVSPREWKTLIHSLEVRG